MKTLFCICGILLWVTCAIEIFYQFKLLSRCKDEKQVSRENYSDIIGQGELQIEYTPMVEQKKAYTDMCSSDSCPKSRISVAYAMKDREINEKIKLTYKNEEFCTKKPISGLLSIA